MSDFMGTSSSLSPWAGPYVTEMLGRGAAIADMPYQAYMGPLTAGPSALQTQAFTGLGSLAVPTSMGEAATGAGQIAQDMSSLSYSPIQSSLSYSPIQSSLSYSPTQFTTGSFTDTGMAQQYMSPYLQAALEPQIAEAQRQAEIQRVQNAGRLSRAGAYGGGRQAIMESEGQRNLLRNLADITGRGYQTAFGQAQNLYGTEADRSLRAQQLGEQSRQFGARYGLDAQQLAEQSRQFGARYGLDAQKLAEQSRQFGAGYGLDALRGGLSARQTQAQLGRTGYETEADILSRQLGAGGTQRGIEQAGIAADIGQFEEERAFPYRQTQFMQSLLQGLPISTQQYQYAEPTALERFTSGAGGILSFLSDDAIRKALGLD